MKGEISRDEKATRTDPDRHGPLSYRYVPTVDEPQRVEKGDQREDRAGEKNKGALVHRLYLPLFAVDPFCLFQSELHIQLAVHRRRGRGVLLRLPPLPALPRTQILAQIVIR